MKGFLNGFKREDIRWFRIIEIVLVILRNCNFMINRIGKIYVEVFKGRMDKMEIMCLYSCDL